MSVPVEEGSTLTLEQRQAIAVDLLRRLSGYRWTYPAQTVTEEYPLPSSRRVHLSGRPVTSIAFVKVDGNELTADDWKLYNGWQLDIVARATSSDQTFINICRGKTVEVRYTYGLTKLPPVLQRAVDVYAEEIRLGDADPNQCRIPERVLNVTRNGVSWTLLDPQEFLSDGRTGIYEVDLALRVYNPGKAKARARVFTTSNPPARRRTL